MPAARKALLDAAHAVLARRPWPRVRMTDVAAMAGVSRQTLYNEFGSKDGLGRALLRAEADALLMGVEQAISSMPQDADPVERLTAAAAWTVAEARSRPMLRALLTGSFGSALPEPSLAPADSGALSPAQRRADAALPGPAELLAMARDRALTSLCIPGVDGLRPELLVSSCEIALRLALSAVLAPSARPGPLVREALLPLYAGSG